MVSELSAQRISLLESVGGDRRLPAAVAAVESVAAVALPYADILTTARQAATYPFIVAAPWAHISR
ncbi:hypothetical protein AWC11_17320 [Mycobacterium interjectum]|nr:hypothetical protein AWC11_17320 [Mycobacterium interjectum]